MRLKTWPLPPFQKFLSHLVILASWCELLVCCDVTNIPLESVEETQDSTTSSQLPAMKETMWIWYYKHKCSQELSNQCQQLRRNRFKQGASRVECGEDGEKLGNMCPKEDPALGGAGPGWGVLFLHNHGPNATSPSVSQENWKMWYFT